MQRELGLSYDILSSTYKDAVKRCYEHGELYGDLKPDGQQRLSHFLLNELVERGWLDDIREKPHYWGKYRLTDDGRAAYEDWLEAHRPTLL